MFWFNQTIIREPTVCASLKLQYCNFSEAQTLGSLMMILLNRNM